MIKTIPRDPVLCMSFINMQLRDYYPDLDELCEDFGIEKEMLTKTLGNAGFSYRKKQNQFH